MRIPKDIPSYMLSEEIANSNRILYLFRLDLDISKRRDLGYITKKLYQNQIGERVIEIVKERAKGLLSKIKGD